MRNAGLKFICKTVELNVTSADSAFTSGWAAGAVIRVPIAHHDGNYTVDPETMTALRDQDRIALQYVDNPNGSMGDIAGVLSENRRVLGLMPHPERAISPLHGSSDGAAMFRSLAGALAIA